MKIKNLVAASAVAFMSLGFFSAPASATIIQYKLVSNNVLGSGLYGLVTLDNAINAGAVTVNVLLATGYTFAATSNGSGSGSNKYPFVFNLNKDADPGSIVFSKTAPVATQAGISVNPPLTVTNTQTPFGEFTNGITYTGANGTLPYNDLDFILSGSTFNNFIVSTATNAGQLGGYLFSADVSLNGTTFTVATGNGIDPVRNPNGDPTTPVPEPTTLALLGLGLVSFAVASRRKN